MSRRWDNGCDAALRFAYRQAAGRATRPAVVESTPSLEFELLWMLVLRGGFASFAQLFDRAPGDGLPPAPTWAMLAADQLVTRGLLMPHPRVPYHFIVTEAGTARVGRSQGARS